MAASAISFDEQTLIPDLLQTSPQARAVLDRYGLRGCGGPNGPYESLGFFARAHDVPIAALLQELHGAVQWRDRVHGRVRSQVHAGGQAFIARSFWLESSAC